MVLVTGNFKQKISFKIYIRKVVSVTLLNYSNEMQSESMVTKIGWKHICF